MSTTTESSKTTIIKLDDKAPLYTPNLNCSIQKLFENKLLDSGGGFFSFLNKKKEPTNDKIEAVSSNEMLEGCEPHALFHTWHMAYAQHLPLKISSNDIKLAILQGFATHVNENSEALRDRFVNHQGQKTIEVRRDDFGPPGGPNPWPTVFSQFAEKLVADLKDKELCSMIQHPCSTTTPIVQAVNDIALLDTFQKYYSYLMTTMCGIPSIHLEGTVEDWIHIKDLVQYISQYDLEWWTEKLNPILDHFIAASQGKLDVGFWKDIVKRHDIGSGGPGYSGWIRYLFPYLTKYGTDPYRQDWSSTYIFSTDFTTGLSSTPFVWNYYGTEYSMKFCGGFIGMGQDENGCVYPAIHWTILNQGVKE